MTDATRLAALTDEFVRTVLENPYVPHKPSPKQATFLLFSDIPEVFYGGCAGGGKSDALLMAAAQYVGVPGYSAILFRNTEGELTQADGLVPRSMEWWKGRPEVKWNGNDFVWTWVRTGATIRFSYMERDEHALDHRGGAYQMIGYDESTLHTQFQYTYLFRSLRKPSSGPLSRVPLRVRPASNPGGKGHGFFKERFVPDEYLREADEDARFSKVWWKPDPSDGTLRLFVPARLKDNPHLDYDAYVKSLGQMDEISRAQQLHGDWRDFSGGHFFKDFFGRRWRVRDGADPRNAWVFVDGGEAQGWRLSDLPVFVAVDPAFSDRSRADFTAAGAFARTPQDDLLVLEVVRKRFRVEQLMPAIKELADRWGTRAIGFENNSAQRAFIEVGRLSGVQGIQGLSTRNVGKFNRASPTVWRASQGKIILPRAEPHWVAPFLAELLAWTGDDKKDAFSDQVDMLSWADHMRKSAGPRFATTASVPVPEDRRLEDRSRRHTDRGIFGRGR